MSKPTRVFASSDYRQDGETNVNFTNNFQVPLENVARVDIMSIQFYNLVYPFKSSNNTFEITDASGNLYTVLIPTDRTFADGDALISLITSSLQSAGYTDISGTYNDLTNKITFDDVSGNNFDIELNSDTGPCLISKLGFMPTQTLTGANTYTAEGNPILSGGQTYYLRSSMFGGCCLTPTSAPFSGIHDRPDGIDMFNIALPIPVSGSYGDLINYTPSTENFSHPVGSNISEIHVSLLDDDFEPLQLAPNAKVLIEYKISYKQ